MSGHLSNYDAILKGRMSPRYLLAKRTPVEFSPEMEEKSLWAIQAEMGRKFFPAPESDIGPGMKSLMDLKVCLADRMMKSCSLCERDCGKDRSAGKEGHCEVLEPHIASQFMHYGEERVLVPSYTIFFAGCNFECAFCQNSDISTDPKSGRSVPADLMARRIENLSEVGRAGFKITLVRDWGEKAKNINWVGGEPTPNLAYVLHVLREARTNIPQIWNSNMYMSEEAMQLLGGVIDVYLADFKYGNDDCAKRYSKVNNYFKVVTRNHVIASEQADLLVRHLMLPGHLECCTLPILDWLAKNTPDALVNIMDQYRPMHRAHKFPELMRTITDEEHQAACQHARDLGLALV